MEKYIKDHTISMVEPTKHITLSNQAVNLVKGHFIEETIGNYLSMFFTAQDLRTNKPE